MVSPNPLLPSVEFDPENHTYTVNGENYPSVTTILGDAGIVQKDKYPQYAAPIGKDIHTMLQLADEDDLDVTGLDENQWLHYENWVKIKGDLDLRNIRHEMIIFDMIHKYAGTIDVVSDDVIVEIKSGRKERWHQLQVAAYALAYRGYFGNEPKGIHLAYTKTGEVVTIDNLDYLEDIFVSALNIARWKNETRKRPSRDTDFDSE